MPLPGVGSPGVARPVLSNKEQRRYEKFRKIDPPQFQSGKDEDAHEFLNTCHELLESVDLAQTHGVLYTTLSCVVLPGSGGALI